jgi:hypothetical protein
MDLTERMQIEWQLTSLTNRFVYYMDSGNFEAMVELFTPDALFDRAGNIHRGHAEIRQGMLERPKVTTRHLLTNFYYADVEYESARATVCSMVYHGPPQKNDDPVVYATENGRVVEFRDLYAKTARGWRISSRIARPIFTPKIWP